ncbi:amidohydrolase [Shewanella denitrificans OS217]|uniref:Amidohydrolase n=1 Tax=Shewanella denitrificans (strain OS217 / ATCC BAA-1090 / DSM 15013) TaxID=318161 RepID=Q12T96_SHEDO|nr:amidohydrolase family protein [Shewanella denitrificans]ABE53330.1 amidohydrolase [Shewanella denitrificans OS217]
MKTNKRLALSIACALLFTGSLSAQTLAIKNATVHTATAQGVLTGATVLIEDNKIIKINPKEYQADAEFDAEGKILTPGFIGSMNPLGLVEIGMVGSANDSADKKASINFDPSLGFNPKASTIAFARKGGVTTNLVVSSASESIFAGQGFVVSLSGEWDSMISAQGPLVVNLGAKDEGSRAMSLQELAEQLDDAQKAQIKANNKASAKHKKDDSDEDEPSRDQLVLIELLKGNKTLIAEAHRGSDILALLKLKQQYQLKLVISGAADAVLVAQQLVDAQVPVIINAMDNLPDSFDSLNNAMNNAAKLNQAGVKIILAIPGDSHGLYGLRFTAGNAVANGLPAEAALKALTANVADVFQLNSGRIEVGKDANLVLWSGDPFEYSTRVEKLWIDGKEQQLESRQDKLRDRYMSQSILPKAYNQGGAARVSREP